LTQLNVASFPWDPKPDPPVPTAVPAAATTTASNPPPSASNFTQAQLSPSNTAQPLTLPTVPLPSMNQTMAQVSQVKPEAGVKAEPGIKQEPGANPLPASMPPFPPGPGSGNTAANRAAQQLHSTYGPRAAASISAIHSGIPQAGARPVGQPGHPTAQQYRAQVAAQQAAQQRMQQNGLANSQVDGTGDAFEGVLMQRNAAGDEVELGRVEIDKMLHQQMAARAKQMEGGGLMLPLKQATKHKSVATEKAPGGGSAQVDGGDDDLIKDELDEDAINSDLDDPDDDQNNDDDDDDQMGPIMLCMYDKVQRVKNKWYVAAAAEAISSRLANSVYRKCTLKDGVLTVNGKEYVFHKATGEYEW